MSPVRWRRLRHAFFPAIGERVLERRWTEQRVVPFLGWMVYALCAWTTPRLVAFGIVGVAPTLGWLALGGQTAAAGMGFVILALLLVNLGMGWLLRPRLVVRSVVPVRVECGRPFPVQYRVENRGRRATFDLGLEMLPFPHLLELRFDRVSLAGVPAGGRVEVQGEGRPRRRGRYRLQPLRWDTDFPLGLWRWGRTDWTERPLTVYPRYTPLVALDIPLGARNRLDVQPSRHLARSALEFHGCREFRQGDALRHVHPRSSARLGAPVVKEFQAEGHGRTAILVDTWRTLPMAGALPLADSVIEAALSLAAAVVENLAQSDRVLELLVAGPGMYRFVSAGRIGFFEEVLDILSSVEPCRADPLPELTPLLIEEIREIQSVCLILGRWDERRAKLARDLAALQVGVKVVLISRGRSWAGVEGLAARLRRKGTPLDDVRSGSVTGAGEVPPDAVRLTARAILRGEVVAL